MVFFSSAMSLAGWSILASFLSKVAGESFFLAALLSVWCPVEGVRKGDDFKKRCFVAAGCAGAIGVVVAIAMSVVGAKHAAHWNVSALSIVAVLNACLGLACAFLGTRLCSDLREVGSESPRDELSWVPETDEVKWRRSRAGGVLGEFKAYDPEAYSNYPSSTSCRFYGTGEVRAAVTRHSFFAVLYAPAFVVPFLSVFAVEFAKYLTAVAQQPLDVAASMLDSRTMASSLAAGAALAVVFAVLLGYLLERQCSERRLLFTVALGLCCLSLAFLSNCLFVVVTICASGATFMPLRAGRFVWLLLK